MKKESFEKLVEESLNEIPEKFKNLLQNIAVIVEESPPRDIYRTTGSSPSNLVLGLYHGVPYKKRGPFYGNIPPDVIVIYQHPIEQICFTEEAIKHKVKEVVLHEIGHYFGLTEKDLKDIEDS